MFDAVQIPVSITYGIAQIADTNILHVWLKFEEHIIDNAFAGDNEEAFVRMKTSTIYIEDTSMLEKGNLFTGDEYTRDVLGVPDNNEKGFQVFLKRPDAVLEIGIRNFPQIGVFYDDMTEKMKSKFNVTLKSSYPDTDVDTKCWTCDKMKPPEEPGRCSVCRVARYCDKLCQKKDWRDHKYICLEHTGYLSFLTRS